MFAPGQPSFSSLKCMKKECRGLHRLTVQHMYLYMLDMPRLNWLSFTSLHEVNSTWCAGVHMLLQLKRIERHLALIIQADIRRKRRDQQQGLCWTSGVCSMNTCYPCHPHFILVCSGWSKAWMSLNANTGSTSLSPQPHRCQTLHASNHPNV